MLTLNETEEVKSFALFNLGFRPFFLLAGIFAVISMLIWMVLYFYSPNILPSNLPALVWHGHEMVFGYGMAVVSGFLLTAIKNWTGKQTIYGNALMGLSLLWVIARILPFSGLESAMLWAAVFDMGFMLFALVAMTMPIIQARQKEQIPIILKIVLLLMSNGLFYLGLLGILPAEAINWGLYSGLYLIVSLIILMGRRVIPFFIEKGVDEVATIKNWKWLDISSLWLFLAFLIIDVFFQQPLLTALFAATLFVLHTIRLVGWYTKGIWKKPLLWILYVGYMFVVLGFALKALAPWVVMSPWLPIHAFAVGGVGLITAGMMSRVALGHTGMNVFNPPAILKVLFVLLIGAAVIRVIFPMILLEYYSVWVATAQVLWISGFAIFAFTYTPILIKPRVDGRPG